MIATVALLASLAASQAGPPAGGLDVQVEPREITVGDRARVTLTLATRSPDSLVRPPMFPNWGRTWGRARIVSVSKPERIGQGEPARFRQVVEVALFETGMFELPPPAVVLETADGPVEIRANAGPRLRVVSVLPAGEEQPAPMPAAPPRALPLGSTFWWTTALLAAICLGVAWLAARSSPAARRIRLVPPRETLAERLALLAEEQNSERLHTGISLAFRRYLGGRLEIPAAEGTTSEIRRWLRALGTTPELVKEVSDLLLACDGVKFARVEASRERGLERLELASRLADDVELAFAPTEADEGEDREEAA